MAQTRRQLMKRRRPLTAVLSLAGHLLVLLVIFPPDADPPKVFGPEPMSVELVEAPREVVVAPTPPAPAASPAPPSPAKSPPPRVAFRPTLKPPPPDIEPLPAGEAPTVDAGVEVSDAQLAGAATAGSGPAGGGGGGCNMLRRLQTALRKDAMVQAAVAEAHQGRPIMVWNGDWVRHPSQEGSGLAAVREAIMWEVGFAPPACRTESVRGLVLISLNDRPGSARLVVGSGQWRWSDLLFSPSGGRSGASSRP
jgi:hypothetical protein